MQMGIFFWFGYPISNKDRLKLIACAGFNNVSFWWGDQYIDIDGPKEMLPELARQTGLDVENVHTDCENTNLLWSNELGGEDVFNRYIESIEACYNFQIPTMILHLSSGDNPPIPNDLGLNRIKKIIELAEKKNVNIAFENLRKPEYLDFVFERITSDKLKFCYDSGHENCFSKKGDLLDKFGDKLIALHLHDNNGIYDQHSIPGEGSIDWNNIALKLKQKKYHSSISLEVTNEFPKKYKNLSAEQFLYESYKQARKIAESCE